MLRIEIRRLREGVVPTDFVLAPEDPAIADLGLKLTGPVEFTGTLQGTSGNDFLWRAGMQAEVAGECRRCLTPLTQAVDSEINVVFSSNPELLDDPDVYALPPNPVAVDLGEPIREELVLRAPAYVLCKPECRGLCATCGADLNAGACACAAGSTN